MYPGARVCQMGTETDYYGAVRKGLHERLRFSKTYAICTMYNHTFQLFF